MPTSRTPTIYHYSVHTNVTVGVDDDSEVHGVMLGGCADDAIERVCTLHHISFAHGHPFHYWQNGGWWQGRDRLDREVTIVAVGRTC